MQPHYSKVTPSKITASRALKADPPQNAFDGIIETFWAEGAHGDGTGQSLTVTFAKPTDLARAGFTVGDQKAPQNFATRPVPRTLELVFYDADGAVIKRETVALEQTPKFQKRDADAKGVSRLVITIRSTYPPVKGTRARPPSPRSSSTRRTSARRRGPRRRWARGHAGGAIGAPSGLLERAEQALVVAPRLDREREVACLLARADQQAPERVAVAVAIEAALADGDGRGSLSALEQRARQRLGRCAHLRAPPFALVDDPLGGPVLGQHVAGAADVERALPGRLGGTRVALAPRPARARERLVELGEVELDVRRQRQAVGLVLAHHVERRGQHGAQRRDRDLQRAPTAVGARVGQSCSCSTSRCTDLPPCSASVRRS